MNDKYNIENNNINGLKLEWATALCDFIRDSSINALYYSSDKQDLEKIYGYVILKDGTFGIILRNPKDDRLYVIFANFVLSFAAHVKFIAIKYETEVNMCVEISDVYNFPNFVLLNDEIMSRTDSIDRSIFKIYMNAQIMINSSNPPEHFTHNRAEWIKNEGLLSKMKITLEVE
jgi:hypothetical protein